MLQGALSATCRLEPSQLSARAFRPIEVVPFDQNAGMIHNRETP
jgi:hypothetical protein